MSGNLYLFTTLVGDCPRHDICQKKLHRQIFGPKILHRKFLRISTVLVIRTQRMCCLWRNLHCWQNFIMPLALLALKYLTSGLSLKLVQSFLNLIRPLYVLNGQSPINIHYMFWTPSLMKTSITSLRRGVRSDAQLSCTET